MAIPANENQFENAQKSSHVSTNDDQLLQTGKDESSVISLINLFHKNIKCGPEYVQVFRIRGERINDGSKWYYLSFTQNKERQDNKLGTFLTDPVFHSNLLQ